MDVFGRLKIISCYDVHFLHCSPSDKDASASVISSDFVLRRISPFSPSTGSLQHYWEILLADKWVLIFPLLQFQLTDCYVYACTHGWLYVFYLVFSSDSYTFPSHSIHSKLWPGYVLSFGDTLGLVSELAHLAAMHIAPVYIMAQRFVPTLFRFAFYLCRWGFICINRICGVWNCRGLPTCPFWTEPRCFECLFGRVSLGWTRFAYMSLVSFLISM